MDATEPMEQWDRLGSQVRLEAVVCRVTQGPTDRVETLAKVESIRKVYNIDFDCFNAWIRVRSRHCWFRSTSQVQKEYAGIQASAASMVFQDTKERKVLKATKDQLDRL